MTTPTTTPLLQPSGCFTVHPQAGQGSLEGQWGGAGRGQFIHFHKAISAGNGLSGGAGRSHAASQRHLALGSALALALALHGERGEQSLAACSTR